mgnify:FL=1|jgi:hypothetical protein
MAVRRFAAITGLVFLLLGLYGYIDPGGFGLFHLGGAHNVIHLIVGILGLAASFGEGYAFRYSQVVGVLYLLLAVIGVFTGTLFGLMHVGLADNVLHFVVGAIALYFGFVLSESAQGARSYR